MADRPCGPLGNLFTGNCAILFFILVFLLLFDGFGCGYGGYGGYCDPK